MNTRDDTISVAMTDVACTGQESVLVSCKRKDGNSRCVDNIGAQALCEPSKWKSANIQDVRFATLLWGVHNIANGILWL